MKTFVVTYRNTEFTLKQTSIVADDYSAATSQFSLTHIGCSIITKEHHTNTLGTFSKDY